MGNLIRKVDEFFAVFIDDEAKRFFVMHLPFWSLVIWISWLVAKYVGLYLLWLGAVFVVTPFVIAAMGLGIYNESELQYDSGPLTMFRAAAGLYVISVLSLIGIPGWYFGFVLQMIQSQVFRDAYWAVLVFWWKVFNFYHEDTLKDMQAFADGFVFHYRTWQWCFLVSAVAVAPVLFYWLYSRAKEIAAAEEQELARLTAVAEQKRIQDEAREKELAARKLAYEERLRLSAEIEKEKQHKLQEKIKEIKGEDPWDSGFL